MGSPTRPHVRPRRPSQQLLQCGRSEEGGQRAIDEDEAVAEHPRIERLHRQEARPTLGGQHHSAERERRRVHDSEVQADLAHKGLQLVELECKIGFSGCSLLFNAYFRPRYRNDAVRTSEIGGRKLAPRNIVNGHRTLTALSLTGWTHEATSGFQFRVFIHRCSSAAKASCEYFTTWSWDIGVCELVSANGTAWSPIVQSISPKFHCPVRSVSHYPPISNL
ncbi:uncharacterized protein LOC113213465 [Frankliniella occidentalis]|uniref:Uncharacterized protein LOC113213465 n=1 Tax=Frankliniella occidentalis TaxID=133901 RepID=A0A9C6WYI0_FRAOC|nr:uncharacterized protein LOC113213465 [Frankliniella occidentalis]